MKNFRYKRHSHVLKSVVLPVSFFSLLLLLLTIGTNKFIQMGDEQELMLMQSNLRKAIIQCYANEGFYPADLSYLKEHYKLRINEVKFHVFYECFASNIMPEFEVYEK